jgi:argininosuccinate synthase
MANSASKKQRVLLAFSGGLDTSAIVPWLQENYNAEVIAYCSDLGNAPDEAYLKEWSAKLGVADFIFEDLKDAFCSDFAFKSVRAGATYQDDYLLGTALGRPLIAERIAFYAKKLGATAISHGATGKGNDQLRFEKSWAYLCPDLQLIAPWKIWDFVGRQDLLKYLSSKGFELSSAEKKYSVDVNLFHRSCEGGVLEDPTKEYDPAAIYEWTTPPSKLTNESISVGIEFKNGLPIAVNGKKMGPAELLTALNTLAGQAGVGVVDLLEERANGIKSRGVYETPGGTVLHIAARNLKHLCWDRPMLNLARTVGETYGTLIYDGLWHSDARLSAEAFFEKASDTLQGEIQLKLQGGQARVVSRTSPTALYDEQAVSFEGDAAGLYKHAEGYCRTVCFSQVRAGRRDIKAERAQAPKV